MILVVTTFPYGILQGMLSIVAMDYFHLEPQGNGFLLSYVGIMAMVIIICKAVGFLPSISTDIHIVYIPRCLFFCPIRKEIQYNTILKFQLKLFENILIFKDLGTIFYFYCLLEYTPV